MLQGKVVVDTWSAFNEVQVPRHYIYNDAAKIRDFDRLRDPWQSIYRGFGTLRVRLYSDSSFKRRVRLLNPWCISRGDRAKCTSELSATRATTIVNHLMSDCGFCDPLRDPWQSICRGFGTPRVRLYPVPCSSSKVPHSESLGSFKRQIC
jgi:hypothetical protein